MGSIHWGLEIKPSCIRHLIVSKIIATILFFDKFPQRINEGFHHTEHNDPGDGTPLDFRLFQAPTLKNVLVDRRSPREMFWGTYLQRWLLPAGIRNC